MYKGYPDIRWKLYQADVQLQPGYSLGIILFLPQNIGTLNETAVRRSVTVSMTTGKLCC